MGSLFGQSLIRQRASCTCLTCYHQTVQYSSNHIHIHNHISSPCFIHFNTLHLRSSRLQWLFRRATTPVDQYLAKCCTTTHLRCVIHFLILHCIIKLIFILLAFDLYFIYSIVLVNRITLLHKYGK